MKNLLLLIPTILVILASCEKEEFEPYTPIEEDTLVNNDTITIEPIDTLPIEDTIVVIDTIVEPDPDPYVDPRTIEYSDSAKKEWVASIYDLDGFITDTAHKYVTVEIIEEGSCVQMLHLGSYDNEPESFKQMHLFADEQRLKRKFHTHREIYLSDARKVSPEKLKTVLRFQVE